jgi:hypothetical protein
MNAGGGKGAKRGFLILFNMNVIRNGHSRREGGQERIFLSFLNNNVLKNEHSRREGSKERISHHF